jgi:hypothetical protein
MTVIVTVPELPEPARFEKLQDAPDGSPLQEKLMLLDEKLLTASRAVPLLPGPAMLMVVEFASGVTPQIGVGMVIARPAVAVVGVPSESATCTTKFAVPGSEGIPDMAPVPAFNDSPAGRLPEVMLHVYGATPPVAAKVVE